MISYKHSYYGEGSRIERSSRQFRLRKKGDNNGSSSSASEDVVGSLCPPDPSLVCPTGGNGNCPPSRKEIYADDGSVLTVEMWKPVAVLAIHMSFLLNVSKETFQHSLLCPAVATAAYFSIIWAGKRWMSHRKDPFRLKGWLFSYNLYQVALNCYVAFSLCYEAWRAGMRVWGNPPPSETTADRSDNRIAFLLFVHYQNKYVELTDTIFMILRRKHAQITSMHMYHHVLLVWAWFFVMNVAPGGDAYFGAAVNSITHIFLYSYYGLCIVGYPCPWKKLLTGLQIMQFVVCIVHAAYCLTIGNYPTGLLMLNIFVQANMLLLFGHFWRSRYSSSSSSTTTTTTSVTAPHGDVAPAAKSVAIPEISLSEVRRHRTPEDCWCAIHGQVLDITRFLSKHPGGDVITLSAGREATILAETYHPNGIPKGVIEKYSIGRLPASEIDVSYYSWESPFYRTLRRRVVAKLRALGRPRRGGYEIWIKAIALLLAFFTCLVLLCVSDFAPYGIASAVALGFVCAKIGTCIQHDGNHGAFAKSPWLNAISGWTLDLIGASAFTWEVQHVNGHHQVTNVLDMRNEQQSYAFATNCGEIVKEEVAGSKNVVQEESDPDVFGSYPLMRMHPIQPQKWFHRYQHIYGPFVFALMTLTKCYQQDIDVFREWKLLHIDATCRYSVATNRWRFIVMKLLSVGYMLLAPIYFHGVARGLALFLIAHLTAGETLATFFIVNHVIEGVAYVAVSKEKETRTETDESRRRRPITNEGRCPMSEISPDDKNASSFPSVPLNDWAAVQCQTSVNWSSGSWFWNHVSGGLNHQIEHHLFPSICHTNYVHIQPVVEATCAEFGVPYQNEKNLWVAYWKMIRHLWSLGNEDSGAEWRNGRT